MTSLSRWECQRHNVSGAWRPPALEDVQHANDSGFRFTQKGLGALDYGTSLVSERKLAQVRQDVAIEHRTVFELILALEDEGWQGTLLPREKSKRHSLQYVPGDPKLWYTTGVKCCGSYVLCLLRAPDLIGAGLPSIPITWRMQETSRKSCEESRYVNVKQWRR